MGQLNDNNKEQRTTRQKRGDTAQSKS